MGGDDSEDKNLNFQINHSLIIRRLLHSAGHPETRPDGVNLGFDAFHIFFEEEG
jgi:hypothetical protein